MPLGGKQNTAYSAIIAKDRKPCQVKFCKITATDAVILQIYICPPSLPLCGNGRWHILPTRFALMAKSHFLQVMTVTSR